MDSFDDENRKRLVSMAGGRSKDRASNKEDLVRSVREDRERRALELKREKSAVTIQKLARGVITRAHERRKAKSEALPRLNALQELAKVVAPKQPRFAAYAPTLKLVRLILFSGEFKSEDLARGLILCLNSIRPSIEEDEAQTFRNGACLRFLISSPHVTANEIEALSLDLKLAAGALILRSTRDSSFASMAKQTLDATTYDLPPNIASIMTVSALESPSKCAHMLKTASVPARNFFLESFLDFIGSPTKPRKLVVVRRRLYDAGEPIILRSSILGSQTSKDLLALSLVLALEDQPLDIHGWVGCMSAVVSPESDMNILSQLCELKRLTFAFQLCAGSPSSILALARFLTLKVTSRQDSKKGRLSLKSLAHLSAAALAQGLERSPVWQLWESLMSMDKATISLEMPELEFACGATSLLIDSVDDGDLFLSASPNLLSRLEQVIGFLKQILFETVWMRMNPRASDSSALSLFSRLYERCSRHVASGLVPRTAFLFPLVPQSELGLSSNPGAVNHVRLTQRVVSVADEEEDEEDGGEDAGMEIITAQASPRGQLLLRTLPFAIPFDQRVSLFHSHLLRYKEENRDDRPRWNELTQTVDHPHRVRVTVRRDTLVEDAFSQLQRANLTGRLQVSFVNDLGLDEAGIDGGGLFKEFMTLFCKTAFAPEFGLFALSPTQQLFPAPRTDRLALLEFVGKMLGKAVFEGILMELSLSPFVLNLARGSKNTVNDLVYLDPELYRNLMRLRTLPDADLNAMGMTFTASSLLGHEVELVPTGRSIPVTKDNVAVFVEQYADFKLNRELKAQVEAFVRGFNDLIEPSWVRLFSPSELEMVIGGTVKGFDVSEMRKNAAYGGGYHPSQPYIQEFWDVVTNELDPEQRGKLLRFITSCSRPPLAGFGSLDPKITIYQVRDEIERLPTASTCVNLLKLPKYPSRDVLRQKLLTAIESDAGFELS